MSTHVPGQTRLATQNNLFKVNYQLLHILHIIEIQKIEFRASTAHIFIIEHIDSKCRNGQIQINKLGRLVSCIVLKFCKVP